jgi:hypothetical protein
MPVSGSTAAPPGMFVPPFAPGQWIAARLPSALPRVQRRVEQRAELELAHVLDRRVCRSSGV